jgi:hypothetical protein
MSPLRPTTNVPPFLGVTAKTAPATINTKMKNRIPILFNMLLLLI